MSKKIVLKLKNGTTIVFEGKVSEKTRFRGSKASWTYIASDPAPEKNGAGEGT